MSTSMTAVSVLDNPARMPAPALAARVDAVIDAALAKQSLVGTVVLIAHDGDVVYRRAAGFADRETQRAMREDTVFRYASLTKPIVTVAALRLVEAGVLRADDPVTRWLPAFRPQLADGTEPVITVHQLLTHTSGLGYGFQEPPDAPYRTFDVLDGMEYVPGATLADNLQRLAAAPLFAAPGSGFRYSLSLDVLGAVIERATGSALPEVVERLVTGPLKMGDTAFHAREPERLAVPYADARAERGETGPQRMNGDTVVPMPEGLGTTLRFSPDRALDASAYPSGGAGMVGTAEDFLRFLEAVRTGGAPFAEPSTAKRMFEPHVGAEAEVIGPGWGFGYGGALLVDPAPTSAPMNAGTLLWGGVYGHMWFVDRAARLSVVALTDTAFEGMIGGFTVEIQRAVYGR
ncbi:serine hydrolase domain-containing protein [Paraburkholderia phosphatilytica]|uniref:serine hydrolase domain-containing protein n=1 Tax=Paraburkholderia phosphatilytica TaxID=2282883 RepID=UPI001F0BEEA7|nr:serine hydrolase domain-containing protein [Paraburkholderia phosphatilytica]